MTEQDTEHMTTSNDRISFIQPSTGLEVFYHLQTGKMFVQVHPTFVNICKRLAEGDDKERVIVKLNEDRTEVLAVYGDKEIVRNAYAYLGLASYLPEYDAKLERMEAKAKELIQSQTH